MTIAAGKDAACLQYAPDAKDAGKAVRAGSCSSARWYIECSSKRYVYDLCYVASPGDRQAARVHANSFQQGRYKNKPYGSCGPVISRALSLSS